MDEEAQRARPESWAAPPPPPVAAGTRRNQWLERVAHAPADHSTMLLSAVGILVVSLAFIISIIKYWYEPRLILMYSAFMFFNAALYFRRRLLLRHWPAGLHRHQLRPWLRCHRRQWLRRGLGYAAILLGASFMFSFVLYCFPPSSMPMPSSSPLCVGVCLGLLAVGEYFFYCLVVLHLDEEEEAMQMHVHAQV